MIKLKYFLKEDVVDDKFGDVAFGSNEKIARLQGKKEEEDTDDEEKILHALEDWVGFAGQPEVLYKNFSLFKKAAKKFPNIFLPNTPNGTTLYRGLGLVNPRMKKIVENSKEEDWKKERGMYVYSKPIKYTPHGKIQSWTTSLNIIKKTISFGEGEYVLITKQTDEFFFSQKVLNILFGSKNENEVIHFGKTYKENIYLMINSLVFKKVFG